MEGQLRFNHKPTFAGGIRIEVYRSFPSTGMTPEKGLPPGVFHRLGSLRLLELCRTEKNRHGSHGQSLRAARGKENAHHSTWTPSYSAASHRPFHIHGGSTGVGLDEQTTTLRFRRLWDRVLSASQSSHEANYLLSQPPSSPTLHRHGQRTRFTLRI